MNATRVLVQVKKACFMIVLLSYKWAFIISHILGLLMWCIVLCYVISVQEQDGTSVNIYSIWKLICISTYGKYLEIG